MSDNRPSVDLLAHLTEPQQRAVKTTDRDLLVSAAAGSGKTMVLAERCAALVCDVPEPARCQVDELLVLTFTEAAAGEMRSRIRKAIKKRLELASRNAYLENQLFLVEQASISTIHAFCLQLIQRWFPQADIDPQATVMPEDEADLLRREVLDRLFVELYGQTDELSTLFQELIDNYGSGQDRQIADIVLQMHGFYSSLADRDNWLERASSRLKRDAEDSWFSRIDEIQAERLKKELDLQSEHAKCLAATIRSQWPIAQTHADALETLALQLDGWHEQLDHQSANRWEEVARAITCFDFPQSRRKPPRLDEASSNAYDRAKACRDEVRKLFADRLVDGLCRFSSAALSEGLAQIAPPVATLCELVKRFDESYRDAKQERGAVDFNDLQRQAFQLLRDADDPSKPSEVARHLQTQYRYVLVDEFQDIDPLQEAIISLLSRSVIEGQSGNLFLVGDVKQSIYRFRLAEPDLFRQRVAKYSQHEVPGEVIHLQKNFRSRPTILEAINLFFDQLMTDEFGGSAYDENTRLNAGADYDVASNLHPAQLFSSPAVECHLLEPVTTQTQLTSASDDVSDDELEGIDREGHLIGQRIREWIGMDTGHHQKHVVERDSDGQLKTRPVAFRDIVILLRSLPHKAQPIADVLRRMGIPVSVGHDDAGFNSTEFRDVHSLLCILDNGQQDIPLAALLRSPLLNEPLDEDALLMIRLAGRGQPFYQAVSRYAEAGEDIDLRNQLRAIQAKINRYRENARQRPIAQVLWQVYEENHYLGYVLGLPDGQRRHENLLELHEQARQFGRFQRQGLQRFLRFLDDRMQQERGGSKSTVSDTEDAVRIMTIHNSKGLEFPVVILADAGKRFNLSDLRQPVLIDRDIGLALQAADSERQIRYPTLIYQLGREQQKRQALSEELRVLYVALTRAKEHLLIVGRCNPDLVENARVAGSSSSSNTLLALETASNPLAWIIAAVAAMPTEAVGWDDAASTSGGALITVTQYDRETTDAWRIPSTITPESELARSRYANLAPLPPDEPVAKSESILESIAHLEGSYPALELTTTPARVSVSEMKRRFNVDVFEPDEQPAPAAKRAFAAADPEFYAPNADDVHRLRGIATHRFLQWLDLAGHCDADDLARQLDAMVQAGKLSDVEAPLVMQEAVSWFLESDLGQRVRRQQEHVQREVPFVSSVDPQEWDQLLAKHDDRDVILLRGTVDLLLAGESGLEIIDYKTDRVQDVARRAQDYQLQIDAYARAMRGIYRQPVVHCYLVFLHAREFIEIQPQTAS
jgi:ATP-dependent helicase/nuclease subunit A